MLIILVLSPMIYVIAPDRVIYENKDVTIGPLQQYCESFATGDITVFEVTLIGESVGVNLTVQFRNFDAENRLEFELNRSDVAPSYYEFSLKRDRFYYLNWTNMDCHKNVTLIITRKTNKMIFLYDVLTFFKGDLSLFPDIYATSILLFLLIGLGTLFSIYYEKMII
ncbi:MAG: hypothetical protein ACTSVM_03050, partial [Candidatus Ranarchaeia archaeon]